MEGSMISTDEKSFFGLTPIPTVLLDASLRVIQTSASFLSLYNITAEECSGIGIYDLIDSKLLVPGSVSVRSSIEIALAGKNAYTLEGIVEREENPNSVLKPRYWSLRAIPVFNGEALLYVSLEFQNTTHDLTKQTAAESRLVSAHEEASRARSEFLTKLCHEIRTHVDEILSPLPLLLDPTITQSQRELSGEEVKKSGHLLLDVINDVLDCYSPSSSTAISVISDIKCIPDLLTSVIRDFQPHLKSGVSLDVSLDPNLPKSPIIHGDLLRSWQIIRNLVSNAVKFTEAGSIHVRTSVVEKDITSYTIRAEVIDTGIGVPDSVSPSLFTPLVTKVDSSITANPHRATGIGLSISRALAELMGGSIGFYPNPNPETRGSVFWVSIKMTKELSAEKAVAAGGERGEGGNVAPALTTASAPDAHKILREEIAPSKRLLLAEDNPTNQKLITRILKGLGFETVDIAHDGEQAAQLCAKRPLQYDLILMDVSMPVLDGIAATKEIREAGLTQIPIIALAATAVRSDMDHFLVQGMTDFVSKPVRRDMLADVLLKWLK